VFVKPPALEIKKGKKKVLYFLGPGNGQNLISTHFLSRFANCGEGGDNIWPGTEFSNFVQRSMFVWTQTTRRRYKCNTFSDYESLPVSVADIEQFSPKVDESQILPSIRDGNETSLIDQVENAQEKSNGMTEVGGTHVSERIESLAKTLTSENHQEKIKEPPK
jgi:hypothetical protein